MIRFSILVPVYNVENYLRQCLDSLLAQTMRDFELICINDGSTDGSLAILKEYELKDSRIRLINKENEGYGKTMNRGIEEAESPYIGIVESDDFVEPEMFERLYNTMEKNHVDLVKCNFYRYASHRTHNEYGQTYPEEIYGRIIEPIHYPKLFSVHSSIWAALYSKSFLVENQICFNETPGASFQDVAFHFKVLSLAKRMTVIPDKLLYYRVDNLMSSVNSPYKIYSIFDEIHSMEEFAKKQDKERQEKLWPIIVSKKYYEYRWHCWTRLAVIFQFAFFEKMIKELKQDRDLGKFKNAIWRDPQDQKDFEKMLDNPYAYFLNMVDQHDDKRINYTNVMNHQLSEIGFYQVINVYSKIVIYGAGKIGKYVAEQLSSVGIKKKKLSFAVTDMDGMESMLDGIPVKQIEKVINENKESLVLVAVKGEKQIIMLNYLLYLGGKNILVVDDKVLSYFNSKKLK